MLKVATEVYLSLMAMKMVLLYAGLLCGWIGVLSQNTIGVTQFEDTGEGYTFFSPMFGTKAYLIDACGRLTNEWDRGTRPGLSAYLLDNGLMLRTYKTNPVGPFTSASNAGGLELVNWQNETVWQFEVNSSEHLSHHDAVYLPNGHILVLTWQLVYTEELVSLGRDPTQIAPEGFMWSENILELEPIGQDSAQIVWEWNIKDHYIQDFDPSKQNFGIVGEHPELFDINLPKLNSSNSNATRDWNHFNSIDYHPQFDQILISTRNSDEIWILDHSTTSEEAASHQGGRFGRGGDILYRWGNAHAYRQAELDQQKLFGQHGAQWTKNNSANPGEIIVFNNGNGRPTNEFSTIEILHPPQTTAGAYVYRQLAPFGPENSQIVYGDGVEQKFYAPFLSNAQALDDGHFFINAGTAGRLFKVNAMEEVVWEYIVPLAADIPLPQGSHTNNNWTFRAYHYAADFEGFSSLNLEPKAPIELNPDLSFCLTSPVMVGSNLTDEYLVTKDQDQIYLMKDTDEKWLVELFNMSGQLVVKKYLVRSLEISIPYDGIFALRLISKNRIKGRHMVVSL